MIKEVPSYERAYLVSKQNAKKRDTRILDAMEEQMKECSFSPRINERRDGRSFDAFLVDQTQKQQSRHQKLAHLMESEARSQAALIQDIPTISPVHLQTVDIE